MSLCGILSPKTSGFKFAVYNLKTFNYGQDTHYRG